MFHACHGLHDPFRNPSEFLELEVAEVVVMYLHCGVVEDTDSLSSWWSGNVASLLDNHRWQYAQTGNTLIQLPGKALTLMGTSDTNPLSVNKTLHLWNKGFDLVESAHVISLAEWLAVFVEFEIGLLVLQGIWKQKPWNSLIYVMQCLLAN